MRARIFGPIALLAGGALAVVLARQLVRRRRNLEAARSLDRDEPIEAILVYDDSVDVDSLADVTAAADATVLATAEAVSPDPVPVMTSAFEDAPTGPHDAGDLYGVHTPRAQQTAHRDDDRAQARGENWLEALEEDAVEFGTEPEKELVFFDESDLDSPPTDNRDIPVADRGSAGPRGL